jgi:glycosyltransferase involved in cell wall biosynthesis
MNIELSIITVCYNSAKTIEKCMKSVISQLNGRTEYLIIDGASTDDTLDIIGRYKNRFMKVISEPDRGIYDAMNKGIINASGKWIWFINSDDYIKDGLIAEILHCISVNSNADCIYGDMEYVRILEGKLYSEIKKGPNSLDQLKTQMIIGHPSTICKREPLIQIGMFDIKFKVAADWDLLLRLYNKGYRFAYINQTLSSFYCGGISSESHILERHLVRKKNDSYKFIDIHCIKDSIKKLLYFIFKPIKNKILLKKSNRIQG